MPTPSVTRVPTSQVSPARTDQAGNAVGDSRRSAATNAGAVSSSPVTYPAIPRAATDARRRTRHPRRRAPSRPAPLRPCRGPLGSLGDPGAQHGRPQGHRRAHHGETDPAEQVHRRVRDDQPSVPGVGKAAASAVPRPAPTGRKHAAAT